MEKELTKEEVERRAMELARRVMAKPPAPRIKAKAGGAVAKPKKRGRPASAS